VSVCVGEREKRREKISLLHSFPPPPPLVCSFSFFDRKPGFDSSKMCGNVVIVVIVVVVFFSLLNILTIKKIKKMREQEKERGGREDCFELSD